MGYFSFSITVLSMAEVESSFSPVFIDPSSKEKETVYFTSTHKKKGTACSVQSRNVLNNITAVLFCADLIRLRCKIFWTRNTLIWCTQACCLLFTKGRHSD